MQFFTHYFLHVGFPAVIALVFYRKNWKKTYFLLLATLLVDMDHLLATPVFQASRCSIGYHFLHTYYALAAYILLLIFPNPVRIIGIGLVLHLLTDFIDCLFMYDACPECLEEAPAYELLRKFTNWIGL